MKSRVILLMSALIIVGASAVILVTIIQRRSNDQEANTATSQQGSTKVNGATTSGDGTGDISLTPDAAKIQSSLPRPDQFEEYEQYKDSDKTMYIDTKVGDGTIAVGTKKVAVAYKGWLTNGTLFDESKDGQPFVFTLGERQVIVGWDQGILGMKVGGKRRLIVPASVGYGENGNGPIPGGALLVFDVELIAVE